MLEFCTLPTNSSAGIFHMDLILIYRRKSGPSAIAILPIASVPIAINNHLRFFIPSPYANTCWMFETLVRVAEGRIEQPLCTFVSPSTSSRKPLAHACAGGTGHCVTSCCPTFAAPSAGLQVWRSSSAGLQVWRSSLMRSSAGTWTP